jgi:hypothetical protein
MAGQWFSPGTPVFSTNKSNRYDITEILLKVALNSITLTPNPIFNYTTPNKTSNNFFFFNCYSMLRYVQFEIMCASEKTAAYISIYF